MQTNQEPNTIGKLAIMAGTGTLPRQIIDRAKMFDIETIVITFANQQYEDSFDDLVHLRFHLGEVRKISNFLIDQQTTHVIMAGPIKRPTFRQLKLDSTGLRYFGKLGSSTFGDNHLLSTAINIIETELNLQVIGIDNFLDLTKLSQGYLGRHKASDIDKKDVNQALNILSIISPADIGQSIVVYDSLVLGVEAIEGTDCLIARSAKLRPATKGGVLVKMMKANQETRVDLPTIGSLTAQSVVEAGLNGIVIDANGMLLLQPTQLIDICNKNNVFLYAHDQKKLLTL